MCALDIATVSFRKTRQLWCDCTDVVGKLSGRCQARRIRYEVDQLSDRVLAMHYMGLI